MTPRAKPVLLSLRNVFAGYGKNVIIKGVSFDLHAGEFCALVGLNASGKTTLLKSICGLLPVPEGQCVAADGVDITKLGERRRAKYISYIPQRASKLIGVTVLDAVLMGLNAGLGLLDAPKAGDRDNALLALKNMGVENLAHTDFSALSEGQKQLVILARTLIQNAAVMVMDEPDSALDFLNRHRILDMIRGVIHLENKTGLVTLHDPNLALNFCDRLILICDGKIAADFAPADMPGLEISAALSCVYGELDIVDCHGRRVVMPKGTDLSLRA